MTDFRVFLDADRSKKSDEPLPAVFGDPDDVLSRRDLSVAEKRAVLASWASDARSVSYAPLLRQLDDGSIVHVDEILRALKALDGLEQSSHRGLMRWPAKFRPARPSTAVIQA